MSNLTTELNLKTAVDDDDTADYLTLDLAGSLQTLDGLFNNVTGHTHAGSHQGGVIGSSAFPDNSIPGAKITDGSITSAKISDGTITRADLVSTILEDLFASTVANPSTTYTVAAGILFVFCTGTFTVTLPNAPTTNRPISISALTGTITVVASVGQVYGGSVNISTGAMQNGVINTGDAITYKSDTANWRAV